MIRKLNKAISLLHGKFELIKVLALGAGQPGKHLGAVIKIFLALFKVLIKLRTAKAGGHQTKFPHKKRRQRTGETDPRSSPVSLKWGGECT